MSKVFNIMFNAPGGLDDCRRQLENVLMCEFHKENDADMTRYRAVVLGLELVLFSDHELVNDMGISFEDFSYQLDVTANKFDVSTDLITTFLLVSSTFVYELMREQLRWDSILVEDLQKQIAPVPTSRGPINK